MKNVLTKFLFVSFILPASLCAMDTSKTTTLVSSNGVTFHVQKQVALVSKFIEKNPMSVYNFDMNQETMKQCLEIMKIAHNNKYKQKYEITKAILEYIEKEIPKDKITKLPILIRGLFAFKFEYYIFDPIVHIFLNKVEAKYKNRNKIDRKIAEIFTGKLRSKIYAQQYTKYYRK